MKKGRAIAADNVFFRKLVEFSHDGIYLVNRDFKIIYSTPSAKRITGYDEIISQTDNLTAIIHPEDLGQVMKIFTELLDKSSESLTCSFRCKHIEGHLIWLECTFTNMFHERDINAIVCNFRDISRQKKDEALLQQSIRRIAELELINKSAQIDGLLENITDGIIALDHNRCYTYANNQIGEMLGIAPSSLIGENIWQLFPELIGSATYHAIEEAFVEKKSACNEDYYEPLNLWYENRIYPSEIGLSIFIRDISERKQQERQRLLFSAISHAFNEDTALTQSLHQVLELLVDFGSFDIAEAWFIETDLNKISRAATFSTKHRTASFFKAGKPLSFKKDEGLPGKVWKTGKSQFWDDLDRNTTFVRAEEAKKAKLKSAYGIPLSNRGKLVGVLVLGTTLNQAKSREVTQIFESIGTHLGAEIKRKQLEQELNHIFNFTPDILCTANVEGYFKKINPAMSKLLEYSEDELISKPFLDFVHPLDKGATAIELQNIISGKSTYYIENRYITKSGKSKWLAWTTAASEHGIFYCSAKDITEKKELEELLRKATDLARIGAWEVNFIYQKIHWSEMTREIHETSTDFIPDMETAINFYKEGESRNHIRQKINDLVETGTGFDVELQIVTAKGNLKWIRIVGEAEFIEQTCVRIFGSIQDIDKLKRTELIAKEILEERNNILESIGDAFFAVDQNWTVTYWNSTAEQVLQKSKLEMIGHNLWDIFSGSVDSLSYVIYHTALKLNQAMHFEDYYAPLNKWYEISAYPTGNGLSVYFKDSTERKTSELLLKELNTSLQDSEKRVREFANQLNNALEEERSHMAREIHDEFGQQLSGLKMSLFALKKSGHSAQQLTETIDNLIMELDTSIETIRRLANQLRPVIIDKLGLFASIEWLISDFTKKTGIKAEFSSSIDQPRMDKQTEINVFRICQEALTNIIKHAQATAVQIEVTLIKNLLTIKIMDNGKGIDPETLEESISMGLMNMKERAKLINAELSITSTPGVGTIVELTIETHG